MGHLNATLPKLEPALTDLQMLEAATTKQLNNVTDMLKSLRDTITRARDMANKVSSG